MPLSYGNTPRTGGSLLARLQSSTGQKGPVAALLSFAETMRKPPGLNQYRKRKQQGTQAQSRPPGYGRCGQYLNVEERAFTHSARLADLKGTANKSQEFSSFQMVPDPHVQFSSPWDEELKHRFQSVSPGLDSGNCCHSPTYSVGSTASTRPHSRRLQQLRKSPDRPPSSLELWREEAMQSGRRCRNRNKEAELSQDHQDSEDLSDMELDDEPPGTLCQLARSCHKNNRPRRQAVARNHRGSAEGGKARGSLIVLANKVATQAPPDPEPNKKKDASTGWWYRNLSAFDMIKLAETYNLPIDQVKRAKETFKRYDTKGEGQLDQEEFQLMLRAMLKEQYPRAKDVPRYLFARIDTSQDGKVDFSEFLEWFSMNSFREGLLLPPEQQKMRSIARKWGIPITEAEKMKKEFDKFDSDKSGQIELFEFRKLLKILLKVPAHVDLPENRVNAFWKEIDADGSGEVDFEEFLAWYRKYFDTQGDSIDAGTSTIEHFYSSVRGVSHKRGLDSIDQF